MADFTHLHVHSEYSLLDGQSQLKRLIAATKAGGMNALALTDHGGMYGSIEFYKAAKAAGVKPILGCLLAGQEIITADGVKNVEDIQVGDIVLTHKGRFRKVLRTMQRHYQGRAYTIALGGRYGRTLTLTEEHPILVRTRNGPLGWSQPSDIIAGRPGAAWGADNWNTWACLPKLTTEHETIDVCSFLSADFSIIDTCLTRSYISKYRADERWSLFPTTIQLDYDFGYLLGIYAAEGSAKPNGEIDFTLHESETHIAEWLVTVAQKWGLSSAIYPVERNHSLSVRIFGVPLALLLLALCGKGAKEKRVPVQVLAGPSTVRDGFLEGILDGDGRNPKRPSSRKGRRDFKTASRALAWGVRTLLADRGHWACITTGEAHAMLPSGNGELSEKAYRYYMLAYGPDRTFCYTQEDEQGVYRPISSVTSIELDADVYNFTVEEDNSYVSDFILHNCEGYLAPSIEEKTGRYEYNHLLMLARNQVGYHNLLKLTTIAHTRGYHYRPRVDKKVLAEHAEGLIVTSGCLSGEIPELLLRGDTNGARSAVRWYQDVFGRENFYIEVQDHNAPESPQNKLNPLLYELHRETGAPLLATNDLHYVGASDADAQDVLLCVQTGKTLEDPKRMKFDSQQYYLKTPDEMARLFPEFPDALTNTMRVAEACNVEIEFGANLLPDYLIPPQYSDQDDYLYQLCLAGAIERFGAVSEAVQTRLDYELGIIRSKGLTSYFLIVWDYVNYARSHSMRCVARGSAAGSLVSYVLGITNVDPLRYVLPFERFLNPERKGLPDIDMDFPDDRREEVIRYVADKYGWDKVGQIVTFNTMAAKQAVRDVGRVMGLQSEAGRVAQLIPTGPKVTIDSSLENVRDLRQMYDQNPQIRKLVDLAKDLEGTVRSTGIHAAGVVISKEPLENVLPLQLRDYKDPTNTWLVSQYEQMHIEDLGLIKFDFLGLSNLTILMNSRKFIEESHGVEIDLDRLPTDDAKTYALLGEGETTGVFQLESGAMRTYIKELKPTCIEDVMAMVALYRPGPMDSIPQFIKAKHGEVEIRYLHPKLEPLLRESYGVIVYQDQVLLVAIELAGFTWGEVDKFRKAMSKKQPAEMLEYRDKFIKGCAKNGISEQVAEQVFSFIEPFAGYGFNKCVDGATEVVLPDGRPVTLADAYRNPPPQIMAMWPDGQVKPHAVARIVRSGRKALLEIRTASGKAIRVTPEHRLLTTEGYREAGTLALGAELIVAPQPASVSASQHTMPQRRARSAVAAAQERTKRLYASDPAWRARLHTQASAATDDADGGFIASNGMWCASQPERDMCEWLSAQGIEFTMRKALANGHVCDFYFNGIYWEIDGLDRDARYFAATYGDLPYVVVTPEDFKPTVLRHLGVVHATNGDPIVAIEPCGEAMTYDIEMAPDGPLNYLANGIVSHNSHACAYAWVAYQTAYLKANYTAEFMAATLTTEASDAKKVIAAVDECRRMGVEVLPPDVNKSESGFTVEVLADDPATGERRQGVRFGLLAIKNVGSRPIEELIEARRSGGPFRSLADLFARTDSKNLARGAVECLIKAGALDSLGRRSQLLAGLDRAMSLGQQQRRMREIGQHSLFGGPAGEPEDDFVLPDVPDHPQQQLLAWEKELLNLYLSAHPLAHVASVLKRRVTTQSIYLTEEWAGQRITLGGRITEVRRIMTKRGDAMAAVQMEDLQGAIEIVVFPKTYAATADLWREEAVLLVTGTVKMRDDEAQLVADEAEVFAPSAEDTNRTEYLVRIRLSRGKNSVLDQAHLHDVVTTLHDFPGDDHYEFLVRNGRWVARLKVGASARGIRFCPELLQQLEGILGVGSVEAVPMVAASVATPSR